MTYVLSNHSLMNLEGVHPSLVRVVKRAIEITEQDFIVMAGLRTAEEQHELYKKGRTYKGPIVTHRDGYNSRSNHQAKSDGYGHAVDLVPYVNGGPLWSWPNIYPIRDSMLKAAKELGVSIVWGGDWKMRDGPHYELVKG